MSTLKGRWHSYYVTRYTHLPNQVGSSKRLYSVRYATPRFDEYHLFDIIIIFFFFIINIFLLNIIQSFLNQILFYHASLTFKFSSGILKIDVNTEIKLFFLMKISFYLISEFTVHSTQSISLFFIFFFFISKLFGYIMNDLHIVTWNIAKLRIFFF